MLRLEKEKLLQEQRAKELAERPHVAQAPSAPKKEKKEKKESHKQASQHPAQHLAHGYVNGSFEYFAGGRFECAPAPELLPLPSFVTRQTNGVRHSTQQPSYSVPAPIPSRPSPHHSLPQPIHMIKSSNSNSANVSISPHASQQSPSSRSPPFQTVQQFLAQFQAPSCNSNNSVSSSNSPPPLNSNSNGRNLDHYAAYNAPSLSSSPVQPNHSPVPTQHHTNNSNSNSANYSNNSHSNNNAPTSETTSPLLYARADAAPITTAASPAAKPPQFLSSDARSPYANGFVASPCANGCMAPPSPTFLNHKQPQFLSSRNSPTAYASPYESSSSSSPVSHNSPVRPPQMFLSPQKSNSSSSSSPIPLLFGSPILNSNVCRGAKQVDRLFFDTHNK
jgi:hypothetical protein